jgi:type IV pilus assembly protein PilE
MRNTKGFTLVEVMIVVVVIAILAAIAFPSYQESIRKSRRAEAKSALLQAAQILERCFTEFNSYIDPRCDALIDAGGAFIDPTSDVAPFNGEGYYSITDVGATLTAVTYTLRATPTAIGGQDNDTICTSFELDHTGKKESNGAGNDNANCW